MKKQKRASGEKSSSGAASMTLIVSLLFGWTVAKPPEANNVISVYLPPKKNKEVKRTKELLAGAI